MGPGRRVCSQVCLLSAVVNISAWGNSEQPDAYPFNPPGRAAGIHAPISNHTFRATWITAYLSNGSLLERAQEMAAYESPRTTMLHDRSKERLNGKN
jgi:site-specific recombinase XerD